MHPVRQQRVVDFAHPHPRALLHPLDRGFGGQTAVDRFVDPAAPPFVVSEHLVGFQNFDMFARRAEFGLRGHVFDLIAHPVERAVNPLPLRLDIVGHDLIDGDARLMIDCLARAQPFHQRQAVHRAGTGHRFGQAERFLLVHHFIVGDQFGHHHRGGLQGLDLHLFVTTRIDMLDAQHPHRAFAIDDRHPGEGMKLLLPGFRAVLEVGMRLRLRQIERFVLRGDRARQTFADGHARYVHGRRIQPARGEQFQHAVAQKIDGAHLAIEVFAHDFDHLIELALRVQPRCHDLVQAGQYLAGGCGGGHARKLEQMAVAAKRMVGSRALALGASVAGQLFLYPQLLPLQLFDRIGIGSRARSSLRAIVRRGWRVWW